MSYYDEASLITLFTGAAGTAGGNFGGKIASIKPVEKIIDSEIVINGDFSTVGPGTGGLLTQNSYGDYGWNISSGQPVGSTTKITGGILTIENGSNTGGLAYATTGSGGDRDIFTEDAKYKLVYTITETKGGELKARWNGINHTIPSQVGTHAQVVEITTVATNKIFYFFLNTANSSISIDNVSIKKLEQAPFDWNMDRSTNLGASRINKDGLVERGRTQLLYNTPWTGGLGSGVKAPDGWTTAGALNGTFSATNAQGQITFAATDAYVDDNNKGDRRYLVSPTISTLGVYAQSVYVDAVVGNVRIKDIMRTNSANNTTIVKTFEDNTVVDGIDYVTAGKRYTRIYSLDSSTTTFRYGIGTNPVVEPNVSVTLSRPQLEKAVAPSNYIENKNTAATQDGGLLVDEPRFDYPTNGGAPALLIEGDRKNKVKWSEWFGESSWQQINDANGSIQLGYEAPDGTMSAYKVSNTGTGGSSFALYTTGDGTIVEGTTRSIWAKTVSGTGTVDLLTFNANTDNLFTITNEWQRFELTGSDHVDGKPNLYAVDFRGTNTLNEVLIWGAQAETGSFASSYIPTYGTAITRQTDDGYDYMKLPVENPERYTVFVDLSQEDKIDTNMGVRGDNSDSSIDTLFGYFIPSADGGKTFFFDGNDDTQRTFSHNISDCPTDTKYAFTVDNVSQTVRLYVNGALEQNEDMGQRADLNQIRLSGNDNGAAQRTRTVMYFTQELSITEGKIITGDASDTFAELAEANNYTLHV
jgi:hypothetical protein